MVHGEEARKTERSGAKPARAKEAGEEGTGFTFEFDPRHKPLSDTRPLWVFRREDLTAAAYFAGHVEWMYTYRGMEVRLQADRMTLQAELERREGARSEDARKGSARGKAKEKSQAEDEDRGGLPVGLRNFTLYADGNVRVEVPARRTYFEADSFFYEHATGRGIARGVRLKTSFETAEYFQTVASANDFHPGSTLPPPTDSTDPFARTPLSIHADVLRMKGFEEFDGEGIEFSTCDFGVPHFALAADTVTVRPVTETGPAAAAPRRGIGAEERAARERPGALEPEGLDDEESERHFVIDPERPRFELWGRETLPFPASYWDTRWQTESPIRRLDPGNSSQFGWFLDINWNVNYLLSWFPLSGFLPLDIVGQPPRLGFETAYFTKRGFGYGPNAEYGRRPRQWENWQIEQRRWNHYGEAQYFAIDDHGDEDRSTGLPPPTDDRYWGHIWHRQAIPHAGLFDFEISKLSDRAFLGEYFESIAKEGKEQESLLYWRRNFFDNLAFRGLYQWRENDFQTQVERLPEGKLFLLEQPITVPWATGDGLVHTGLYTDLELQGAYLRRLEDEALGGPARGFARYDAANAWAYPIALGRYLNLRPFALGRITYYEEVLDPTLDPEDRVSFGAGISASQEWSRIFDFAPDSFASRFLGIPDLKHVIVLSVTYLNIFSNDLDPEDLVQIDATDEMDLVENVSFSFRNAVYTRKRLPPQPEKMKPVRPLLGKRDLELTPSWYETKGLLDSDVRFSLFPHPGRDNDGDTSSALILDNTLSLIPRVDLRAWLELDPNDDFHGERTDLAARWEAVPRKLYLTVGDRFTHDETNTFYLQGGWRLTDKWHARAYYSHDFETGRDVEYHFALSRFFHRFVVSVEYAMDVGEDHNQSVRFSFMPVELFRPDSGRGSGW